MSDLQALLKELETVLAHTAVSRYAIVSSLCLYVYDFMLTFSAEVEYFWGSPWSFMKGLFFWNRCFIFPVIAYLTFSGINRAPTDSLVAHICGLTPAVIMQLRVHALYGQNRALKVVISGLFLISVCSELGIAIAKLVMDNVSVQAIPFLVDPLALCVETISKFLVAYPVPMMIFDTIMLGLVVYKTYLIQHEESSTLPTNAGTGARLARIMFRDSVVYFACTVGANLLNVLIWALGPYDLFTVGTAWAVTVPAMAANRILFNMRTAYRRPLAEEDADIGTEFQVARRPDGPKGPTVWSNSSGDAESSVHRM
ncbi:hypothetical protein B0H17DRAFT_1199026 [Mycena rosella]|uniref:DUF6533 domain-containing protein n=1 Tax=Mycena rosella TaxID=1033263 RepID=A0AAD7DP88_MYCRO|nr:hypothetical protein B0H17DRAFT_1199026 [Mycena rosella]